MHTIYELKLVVRALFEPEKELTTHSNCPETEQKEFCLWKALASFTVCCKKSGPSLWNRAQVGKSACIVLAKERHSKGERVPFSACFQLVSKLKSEAASTLSLMFQIFLEKNYRTPWLVLKAESHVWQNFKASKALCVFYT